MYSFKSFCLRSYKQRDLLHLGFNFLQFLFGGSIIDKGPEIIYFSSPYSIFF